MNYDHFREQALANARCLYGSGIEVMTISHKSFNNVMYQAAVMKRVNENSPWVNMLYSALAGRRPQAMELLLDKTESELAKHLLGRGVILPLTGDDSTGFEVSHLVRSGSVASSDGSEFEFIATPASSSAGDFSEDESGDEASSEQDAKVEAIPTVAKVEPIIEVSPLQSSITPVEVSSEPSHPANKTTDVEIFDGPQALETQATASVIKKDNISHIASKNTKHSPWEAPTMAEFNPNNWKERSNRWAAMKIAKDDIKSGPWANMVGELEELAQNERYIPKVVQSFKTSPETVKFSPAGPRKLYTNTWGPKWESDDDLYGAEKEILKDSSTSTKGVKDDQFRKNILSHRVNGQVQKDSLIQAFYRGEHFNTSPILVETPATSQTDTKSNIAKTKKMVQTLAEWVQMGVPPEKMTALRELMHETPIPKAQCPPAWVQEVQESKVSTSNFVSEAPAFSATAGFAMEAKTKLKAKSRVAPNESDSTRTFRCSQESLPIASHTTSPKASATVLSPADTDMWGVWPLPAKQKKVKTAGTYPLDGLFQNKPYTSNSNPWSNTRESKVPWREPEAILDEYDSSLWGMPNTKQKSCMKHASLPAFSTRFSKHDVIYAPEETKFARTVALGARSAYTKSDQNIRQQPGFSRQYATATVNSVIRPTAISPAVNHAPKPHDWSQFGTSTKDHVKAPIHVILSEPESNRGMYDTQFEAKPKNPFENKLDTGKDTQPNSNENEQESWNFGTFTSKPDYVAENVPIIAEKDPWSWKSFAQTQNQQEEDIEKATNVVETKVSPWPYLEPESRPSVVASLSHQSLLDDLAEWGSFSSKEKPKTKKPVAFDYLVETSVELAPKADFKHKKAAIKYPYDDFQWDSFGGPSQKKSSKKERSALKGKTRCMSPGTSDLSDNDAGFGTFSVTTTSKKVDSSDFSWNEFGREEKKSTEKDDAAVSEMSGEDKPATAPVHVDAQKEFRTNVLGLDKLPEKQKKVVETPRIHIPYPATQLNQAPRTSLYAFNITYKHLLGTDNFRHIIDASFTKKAVIIEEVTKIISAREPFGQLYLKRKIVIRSAKGEDGIIDLEQLEDGSWSDILGFLEDTTKVIEVTVAVNDV